MPALRWMAMKPWRNAREGDEWTLLVGKALDELRAGIFSDVELLAARHPVEDRPRLVDGDEIEIDAIGLDLAGVKRLHTVVQPACERKLQLGHFIVSPLLERGLRLSMQARRPKTPIGGFAAGAHDAQRKR